MSTPVLFVGDTHGDLKFWKYLLSVAVDYEIHTVIQLGDFGYWEHRADGVEYLDRLDAWLGVVEAELFFVDGNHESHKYLRRYPALPNGMVPVRSRITWLPRGQRFEWSGVRFLAIGGAHSTDKEDRIQKMNKKARYLSKDIYESKWQQWWPEEVITDDEVARCVAGGQVDVVLAHDVAAACDLNLPFALHKSEFFRYDPETNANRSRLQDVLEATRPGLWLHGHYHLRYHQQVGSCRFEGLAANVREPDDWQPSDAWTIKDLESLR